MTNKPLPRKQRVENRGYQYSRKEIDKTKDISITLEDIDSAILFYFDSVIKPSVEENGENIKVPVLYGSVERWKSILRDGYLRDKKRQIITPLIVFKRTTISLDEMVPQDKLDANNPNQFYPLQKKYSQVNRYDNLTAQVGAVPQREFYNVTFPDYVTVSYEFIVWTSYIRQMNTIVERVNYADGAYWGNPDKMRFRSKVESFEDATEVSDVERLVRTNFEVSLNGYLISEKGNENKSTTEKFITPKTVKFINEVVTENV
tara:strand:- start:745 stop:1524 length:780 start_codon:yes stop_codon:yes gene_type:complete